MLRLGGSQGEEKDVQAMDDVLVICFDTGLRHHRTRLGHAARGATQLQMGRTRWQGGGIVAIAAREPRQAQQREQEREYQSKQFHLKVVFGLFNGIGDT